MKTIFIFTMAMLYCLAMTSCEENLNAPEVSDQQFSVDENAPTGTIIGVVDAYDLDEGQSFSYGIAGGNEGGTFAIDSLGGFISVADPVLLDYETKPEFEFKVVVADDAKDPKQSTATMTVFLNDVNEFAPVVEDQTFEIEEDPAAGALIGTIQATDQEAHQLLLFTILAGNDNKAFALDGESGALTVNEPAAFSHSLNPQLVITVRVRDIHLDSKSDTGIITVNIIPK